MLDNSIDSLWRLLLLTLGIAFAVLGLAYVFQDREDRETRQSRCPGCRQDLQGQPAFCPDCGARSRY